MDKELKFKPGDKICGTTIWGVSISNAINKPYGTISSIIRTSHNDIKFTIEEREGYYWICNLKNIYHYEDCQNVMDINVGDTVRCISENKSKFGSYADADWEAKPEGYKIIGKVKAPSSNVMSYLTPNKVYTALTKDEWGVTSFCIDLDSIGVAYCNYKECPHINYQDWIIVEGCNQSTTPELKWEEGAYVRYKGTKIYDSKWDEYFGKYGVKVGDVGIIQNTAGKFIYTEDIKRKDYTKGFLIEEDLELITKEEYDRGLSRMREYILQKSLQGQINAEDIHKISEDRFNELMFGSKKFDSLVISDNKSIESYKWVLMDYPTTQDSSYSAQKPKLKTKHSKKELKVNKVITSNKQLKTKKNEQIKLIR